MTRSRGTPLVHWPLGVLSYPRAADSPSSAHRLSPNLAPLLFFFRSLWWFFRLRHFHLLSQVVTHTQIFRYPPENTQSNSRLPYSFLWRIQPTPGLKGPSHPFTSFVSSPWPHQNAIRRAPVFLQAPLSFCLPRRASQPAIRLYPLPRSR